MRLGDVAVKSNMNGGLDPQIVADLHGLRKAWGWVGTLAS